MDETVIDNETIERALEERDKKKRSARAVAKQAKQADDVARALIESELDIGIDAPIRIGRFRLTLREIAAKEVSFETAKTNRLTIKADKSE